MSKIQKLLETEMTRKQFLIVLGSGIAGVLGFSGLIGLFTKNTTPSNNSDLPGYGERGYGP